MSTMRPWQLLLMTLAGWINRHQQDVVDYLVEENRVLKNQLRGRRLRLTDDERRRLAVKGKVLGRKILADVSSIVTPDTIMAWYRRLIARKWDYSVRRRPGRPRTKTEIADLVLRMARENPRWGYTRIQGALAHVGHGLSRGTIANILKSNGIQPAFERSKRTPWRTFLRAHWETLAAADFFTVEVAKPTGLVTFYVLFVMELSSRCVHVAGISPAPDSHFMLQVGRGLTDAIDGFLLEKRHLILDRDTKYTAAFRDLIAESGTNICACQRDRPISTRTPNGSSSRSRASVSIAWSSSARQRFGERSIRSSTTTMGSARIKVSAIS